MDNKKTPNMSPVKNKMITRSAADRIKDFNEVALGYDEKSAIDEANRCLNCKTPRCVEGCPVAINIPAFISKIKETDYKGAYDIIKEESSLPAVCGRVCPQESQCESKCVRGFNGESVAIGRLERFVADFNINNTENATNNYKGDLEKVAVVGGGPAGLACAGELVCLGYRVTIFEALHVLGGVLVYGIPEFRLPKSIVEKEVENLEKRGVEIKTNTVIGKTKTIKDLFEEGYKAVFIGSGAGLPRFMNIEGENLNGVYSANEYLTRVNLMKAYKKDADTPIMRAKKVVVVGGGNVAMDAARCAKRMGGEKVYIVYRRNEELMPARKEEVAHAKEEGIIFKTLNNPIRINGHNGDVTSVELIKMELKEADESGRQRPVPINGSEYELKTDCVIMAIGTSPNPIISNTAPDIETKDWGGIVVDESTMAASKEGVYAGGDAVTGAATVILAMGAGKKAAKSIDVYLKSKR